MRNLIFLPILFLSACSVSSISNQSNVSTDSSNNMNLSNWEGKNISMVFNKLGSPNQSFLTASGESYYVYITKNYQEYPSSGYSPGFANLGRERGGAMVPIANNQIPEYSNVKCALIFKVDSTKTITYTKMKGYSCYSTLVRLNK